MGRVYEAVLTGVEGFTKTVAIKLIREDLATDPTHVESFVREAKLAASLVHPNIVQLYKLGRAGESLYIAMELVRGLDLKALCDHHRERELAIPLELAVFMVSRVSRGLAYAHSKRDPQGRPLGLVHRDISPRNIMISTEGEVKITDFGIAKVGDRATDPMVAYGKAAYRAPEQVAGAAVDHRADLFALGIILYELLTGARPFEGPTVALTEATIAQGEPPSPCALNPRIPKALERIVLTALQRDPARRYADAHAMSYALEHFLYHKGYGPTIVTVEEYLRRHLPELYAEEQIVIAGKGEEGTTDLPRPMTTAALPPVRPTGRRQGIPWGLLITIGLGFMMALLGYRFWQYWPRWMAQQARPVTSSPLHESLPAPPMVDAPSEPPRPAKVLVDTTAPLRRETAAFPEPSLFVSKSPQDAQPWIGMITTNLSFVYAYYDQSAEAGVIVAAVHPGSPAEKAGLREGDLVLRVNGEAVAAPGDLDERRWEVDESIALEIQHAEVRRTATLRLRLANAPAEQGGLAELLALYSRRLHADPDNPVTRYLRAITYAQGCMANAVNAIAGDCPPEWARQYLEDAEASARLAPEWTEAQILAAEARSQLGAMEGK